MVRLELQFVRLCISPDKCVGIDLDWEYPGADDRGGRPEDFENFPKFAANLKDALKSVGKSGLTLT
jgi:GH18 family chitinase